MWGLFSVFRKARSNNLLVDGLGQAYGRSMEDKKDLTEKQLRAKWQREWRGRRDKIGATLYLTRSEVDILDWMVEQLMEHDPDSPHVVGRPAAIRALLQDIMDQHKDDILEWAMSSPEPETRAREFQKELGRRRRGPRYAEFQSLPRHRQQTIARNARSKSLAELREKKRKRSEAVALKILQASHDPDR